MQYRAMRPGALKVWTAVRVPVVLALAVAWVAAARAEWFAGAAIVSLFGQAVQAWCFGTLRKNKELATRGPYALVRNPMYLGRYFVILGVVMLLHNAALIGLYTVCYYFYLQFRVRQEEDVLRSRFADEFERYCASVNRFLPKLKPYAGNRVLYFNLGLFVKNHGGWNTLALIAFYVVVAARIHYWPAF